MGHEPLSKPSFPVYERKSDLFSLFLLVLRVLAGARIGSGVLVDLGLSW